MNEDSYNGYFSTLNQLEEAKPIKAIVVKHRNKGYLRGLKDALEIITTDENAETLEDKQETSILEDMLSIKKLSDEILDKDAKTPEELDAIVTNRPQP